MKNKMEAKERAAVEGELRELMEVTLKMEYELYALVKKKK